MSKNHRSHQISGFTLIELMVTLAVLAILIGIATPNFSKQLAHNRIKNTASIVEEALRFSLTESAIRRQSIEFKINNNAISLAKKTASATTPIKGMHINDKSEVALTSSASSSPLSEFVIDNHRRVLNAAQTQGISVQFVICDSAVTGEQGRRISVNAIGRITVGKSDSRSCT